MSPSLSLMNKTKSKITTLPGIKQKEYEIREISTETGPIFTFLNYSLSLLSKNINMNKIVFYLEGRDLRENKYSSDFISRIWPFFKI